MTLLYVTEVCFFTPSIKGFLGGDWTTLLRSKDLPLDIHTDETILEAFLDYFFASCSIVSMIVYNLIKYWYNCQVHYTKKDIIAKCFTQEKPWRQLFFFVKISCRRSLGHRMSFSRRYGRRVVRSNTADREVARAVQHEFWLHTFWQLSKAPKRVRKIKNKK